MDAVQSIWGRRTRLLATPHSRQKSEARTFKEVGAKSNFVYRKGCLRNDEKWESLLQHAHNTQSASFLPTFACKALSSISK